MRLNAVLVALSQLIVVLAPLIVMPFLTRTIGADGLGIYSLSFSIATVCLALGQMGSQLYGRREIAAAIGREDRTRVFWELSSLVFKTTITVMVVYVILVFIFVPRSDVLFSALLIQLLYLISGAIDISWLLHGVERFKLVTGAIVLSRIVNVFWIYLAIREPADSLLYVLIMAITFLIAAILPWLVITKFVDLPTKNDLKSLRHLKPLKHFVVPALALQLFGAVNITIIGFIMSNEDVGLYDLAFRLARSPITLITVAGVVLLPRITALVALGDIRAQNSYLKRGMLVTMTLASLVAFGLIGTADTFIIIFAGNSFANSIPVLQVLALSLLTIAWGNVLRTQLILPQGKDRLYSISLTVGLLVSMSISVILVGPFGLLGAAAGFVLGELVVCIVQTVFIRRQLNLKELSVVACRTTLIGILSCAVMLFVGQLNLGIYLVFALQVISGSLVFIVMTCIVEYFQKDFFLLSEIRKVGKLLRRA